MKIRSTLFACLAAFALTVGSAPATAQQWYAIEVIIFAESGGDAGEYVRDIESAPPTGRAVALGPAAGKFDRPRAFQRIATGDLQLGGAFSRLQSSGRYRPLLHVGWYQPGYSKANARPVRLRARGQVVDGMITVARERFLHLSVDMVYSSGVRSRLKQRRRMRSRELHYLDHPRFGIIVEATPFDGGDAGSSDIAPPVPGAKKPE